MKKYTSLAHTVRARAHSRWGVLIGSFLVLGGAAVVAVGALAKSDEDGAVQVTHEEPAPYYLASSTLPLAVSGVVQAADRAVIYAETNGVITALPAREGARVTRGTLLAAQDTPVADAQTLLEAAENSLRNVTRDRTVALAGPALAQADVRARAAEEVAFLRTTSGDRRVEEAARTLLTSLDGSVVVLLRAADFVDNNRSLFPAEGLRTYDETVAMLYGSVPNFLRGGVLTGRSSDDELLQVLGDLAEAEQPNPEEVRSLGLLADTALRSLSDVYGSGEARALERKQTDPTSTLYSTYLTERTAVATARAHTNSALAELARAADAAQENQRGEEGTVEVSDIDRQLARVEQMFAERSQVAEAEVGRAAVAVRAAEQALGRVRAPFAGTVFAVHRQVGEYAQAGTPLVTLVGTGAREITVAVPAWASSHVRAGDALLLEGAPIGYVVRASGVATNGQGTVVITLTNAAPAPGESVVGGLAVSIPGTYRVPRTYVFFDGAGAYVRYVDGTTARARVRYDAGDMLYLALPEARTEPLLPNLSAAL